VIVLWVVVQLSIKSLTSDKIDKVYLHFVKVLACEYVVVS